MSNAQDRLIVMLEARITEFEKRMARADQTAGRRMRNVESHAERMRKRVDSSLARVGTGAFRNLVLGATAALAPVLSIGAALRTANAALQDFDKLANRASMFGVDVEWLQEMRYAAEQGGMGIENFDTALRRFVRRAAEAAQGTGAAKNAFKELGISLHDNEGRLKASEELLAEVADAMQRVPNQADKLRLAFQMFDTDGAAMVNVLKDGSDGLDRFAAQARDLGIVIDREMIARAQELKGELDTATRVLDSQFKQALIDLAPILISAAELAGHVAKAISGIADAMRDVEHMSLGGLRRQLADLQAELANGPAEDWVTGLDGRRVDLNAVKRQRIMQITAEIAAREARLTRAQTLPSGTGDDLDLGLNRNKAAEAAVKQAEAVARLIANLQHERDQLGRTAEEQELYNALKSVGVELESEYGQAIAGVVSELQAKRKEVEGNAEAMKLFEDAASSAMQTFIDDLIAGKDAGEALGNVLRNLGSQLISMGIKGFTSSLSGMLFPSVGAATGGLIRGPGTGTSDSIPARLSDGEYVVNARATAKHRDLLDAINSGNVPGFATGGLASLKVPPMPSIPKIAAVGGGGGDNITISMPINIDAAGADIAAVARLHQSIEQLKAELPGRVQQVVRDRGRKWK